MHRALLAVALLAITIVATAAAAGTIRYPIPGAGASLAVPSSWKAVDSQTATNSAAFKKFVNENPSLKPFLSQITGTGSVVKLIALDPKLDSGFATNVNVVVTLAPSGVTLTALAGLYAAQLKNLVPTVIGRVRTSIVALPAGKALRATYRLGFSVGGSRLTVQTLQYLLLHGGRSIVITLSTLPSQATARSATFTAIVRSLRFR